MDPDQTAPKELSDLGPYCLQYKLLNTKRPQLAGNRLILLITMFILGIFFQNLE